MYYVIICFYRVSVLEFHLSCRHPLQDADKSPKYRVGRQMVMQGEMGGCMDVHVHMIWTNVWYVQRYVSNYMWVPTHTYTTLLYWQLAVVPVLYKYAFLF